MSIKKLLKCILKPVITEIVEELLQDKVHNSVLYKEKNGEIEIIDVPDIFIQNTLKDRLKRGLKLEFKQGLNP